MKNIVAYCNVDRYEETDRSDGALYDPDYNVYKVLDLSEFTGCKTGVGRRRVAAFTNDYEDQVTNKHLPQDVFYIITNRIDPAHLNQFLCVVFEYSQRRPPLLPGNQIFAYGIIAEIRNHNRHQDTNHIRKTRHVSRRQGRQNGRGFSRAV